VSNQEYTGPIMDIARPTRLDGLQTSAALANGQQVV